MEDSKELVSSRHNSSDTHHRDCSIHRTCKVQARYGSGTNGEVDLCSLPSPRSYLQLAYSCKRKKMFQWSLTGYILTTLKTWAHTHHYLVITNPINGVFLDFFCLILHLFGMLVSFSFCWSFACIV